jgi:anti-sigma factor RsiW
MNPFEEKFTGWVDGKLSGEELEAFEKELSAHPEAGKDKADMLRIGALLRQHSTAPRLTNPEFFNHQLMQRISAEIPREPPLVEARASFWSLRRLMLAGGISLAIAFALFEVLIPKTPDGDKKSHYFAQVVENWTEESGITATTVYDPDQHVTVVWLDGLDYVPGSYAH